MEIALVHNHYNQEHLNQVIEEMKVLGPPKIKAVWMECYEMYAALEGCHRIRAAKELGLTPEIIELNYDDVAELDVTDPELELDLDMDCTVDYIVDDCHRRKTIIFEEE